MAHLHCIPIAIQALCVCPLTSNGLEQLATVVAEGLVVYSKQESMLQYLYKISCCIKFHDKLFPQKLIPKHHNFNHVCTLYLYTYTCPCTCACTCMCMTDHKILCYNYSHLSIHCTCICVKVQNFGTLKLCTDMVSIIAHVHVRVHVAVSNSVSSSPQLILLLCKLLCSHCLNFVQCFHPLFQVFYYPI